MRIESAAIRFFQQMINYMVEDLSEGAERAPFIDDIARPQRVGLLLYRPSGHSAVDDHRRGGIHHVDFFRNVEADHIRHPQVKNRTVRPFPSKHPMAFQPPVVSRIVRSWPAKTV